MDHGAQGLLAYAVHPGAVRTDMGHRLSTEVLPFLVDTPELGGDTIAFLTRERREWLAGRYISCQYSLCRGVFLELSSHYIGTWDMGEFLSKKDEIVNEDKLKVRMVV